MTNSICTVVTPGLYRSIVNAKYGIRISLNVDPHHTLGAGMQVQVHKSNNYDL